ncbi:MAG: hypothetical protein AAFO95_11435 [Cyanobacteria bacterium J06600_6]
MMKNDIMSLQALSFLALWVLNSQAASAQVNNPDSSGTVGDTFSNNLDAIRQEKLIAPLSVNQSFGIPQAAPPSPGSTIGVPSAYGAGWGNVFAGFSGALTNGNEDVAASVGMGFGDPQKTVGFEVGVGFAGLTGDNAGAGLIGIKLHRAINQSTRVALGWSNALKWDIGSPENTFYGSMTRRFELQKNKKNKLPLTATLGLGTGGYRSVGAIEAGNNAANLFGSLGLKIIPQTSLISSWTGSQLNIGTSLSLFRSPVVINVGVTDVTGNRGNSDDDELSRTGFLFSTGYAYSF